MVTDIYIKKKWHMVSWRKIKQDKEVKNVPAMRETQVHSLGWEDPLEKEMATHSGILAWIISWTEEPGGLQFLGSQRVRHDWVNNSFTFKENRMWWIGWRMLFCTEVCVWECISNKWHVCGNLEVVRKSSTWISGRNRQKARPVQRRLDGLLGSQQRG